MNCKWAVGDVLELTRDCELGRTGERAVVLRVECDRYMTVVFADRPLATRKVHTGADYAYFQLANGRKADSSMPSELRALQDS